MDHAIRPTPDRQADIPLERLKDGFTSFTPDRIARAWRVTHPKGNPGRVTHSDGDQKGDVTHSEGIEVFPDLPARLWVCNAPPRTDVDRRLLPSGPCMDRLIDLTGQVGVPAAIPAWCRPVATVMLAAWHEGASRGHGTFFLALRDAGVLAKVSAPAVRRQAIELNRLGYLSRIAAGTRGTRRGGLASVWRWHQEPVPGEAVWNGAR